MKTKDVAKYIIDWLTSYIEDAKLDGFVIGVSGGIDSALTSTLCAMSGKPTLCLVMPIHQEKNQVHRAKVHTAWLSKKYNNVRVKVVQLTDYMKPFVNWTLHQINLKALDFLCKYTLSTAHDNTLLLRIKTTSTRGRNRK